MLERMMGALTFNRSAYDDVEHDTGATWQALAIVIMVSVAGGIGGFLIEDETNILTALAFGVVSGVFSWALWALVAMLVGTTILKTPETEADWGQVARGTGFAQTPGLLNILVFIPYVGGVIGLVVFVWQFICMLFALRESLDYNSLWRAFFVVLISFIPVLIVNIIIYALLGIDDTDTAEAPQALIHFAFSLMPG